ncbi:MAG: Endo-1,4-beta-xylanase A precursor [Firmicutes bacterium ADurb.Bin193]|nr:MAG: Endo-1,4-beta-xylanase A precursor [Firmicutes bacterium ADurb.Bin193]
MRLIKILSVFLAFCLIISVFPPFSAEEADQTLTARIVTDQSSINEGGILEISYFIDFPTPITGGAVVFTLPEGVFLSEGSEYIWAQGITGNNEDGSFTLEAEQAFDSETPILKLKLNVSEDVLSETETSKEVKIAINAESTYITSGGVNLYPAEGVEAEVTVNSVLISGEIDIIGELESVEDVFAKLESEGDSYDLTLEIVDGKITFAPVRAKLLPSDEYALIVSGDGFLTVSTDSVNIKNGFNFTVDGFYPGDTNGDGYIDFIDFNFLCSFIGKDKTDNNKACDLNRDGEISDKDLECLINSYNVKEKAVSPDAPPSEDMNNEPVVYLDASDTNFDYLAHDDTFKVYVKASSVNTTEIFSYNLAIDFDENIIEAVEIRGTATDGVDGLNDKTIDNDNGHIDYWYSLNGKYPSNKTLAIITFKVLDNDTCEIEINEDKSRFFRKADENGEWSAIGNIEYGDDDREARLELDIRDEEVPPPIFTDNLSSSRFSSSAKIGFKERTDGADIYYTFSTSSTPDELYEEPFTIRNTTTIRAFAEINGRRSKIVSKKYTRVDDGGGSGSSGSYNVITYPIPTPTPTPVPTPASPLEGYTDINGHWSANYFEKLIEKKIINGYEDNTLKPDNLITRAEAAKIIIAALGLEPAASVSLPFSDSAEIPSWAGGYVTVAAEKGIITGYEDNTFRPKQNISRKELVVLAARAFFIEGKSAESLPFSDSSAIPEWAAKSVAAVLEKGIITGYDDNTFRPDNFVTRAEACKIISLCMDLK